MIGCAEGYSPPIFPYQNEAALYAKLSGAVHPEAAHPGEWFVGCGFCPSLWNGLCVKKLT